MRPEPEGSEDGPVELREKEDTLQTHGKDKYLRTLVDVLHPMALTSTTRSSKTASAGGIKSMCVRDTVLESLKADLSR